MDIGERIKARRIELGITQDELAKRVGYKSRSTINKIELGVNELQQKKIAEFAGALDTTPAYLMGWAEEKPCEEPAAAKDDELPELRKTLADLIRRFDSAEDFNRIKALSMLTPEELRKVLDYAELLLAARKE